MGLYFLYLTYATSLYFGLTNIILIGLQMLINSAARIVVGIPSFSREKIAPACVCLYVLPIKARIKYKKFLLSHKPVQCKEPLYLNEMLELREPSTMNLRSNYDTWKLVENRVPGLASTNINFKYCASHL